jgi:hypothetical protein
MLLKEAIDCVSYFMDKKNADGVFAEAWNIIFKKLIEVQKPAPNPSSLTCICVRECKSFKSGYGCKQCKRNYKDNIRL